MRKKSDLLHEGKLLISPGDIADKEAILLIKKDKGLDVEEELKLTSILYMTVQKLAKPKLTPEQVVELGRLEKKLLNINRKQWEYEDRVRAEESWQAAYAARMQNKLRTHAKNEVNQLFGYMREVKKYAEKPAESGQKPEL